MKGYEFLEEHEYFSTKREFENHTVYVFRRKLENGEKRVGSIQVATTTEGAWDWYFSNETVEQWFQDLLEKSEKKSKNLFRIKRIVEGKVVEQASGQ